MRKENGFSLVELLVTISILGILAALVIPGFIRWVPKFRLKGAAMDLYSNMQLTKAGAIKTNGTWAVVFEIVGGTNPRYHVCSSPGADNNWQTTNDNAIEKTVSLMADYKSGIHFGHGTQSVSLGGTFGDEITYSSPLTPDTGANFVTFDRRGMSNIGYVYLQNDEAQPDTFAVGTTSLAGVVKVYRGEGTGYK